MQTLVSSKEPEPVLLISIHKDIDGSFLSCTTISMGAIEVKADSYAAVMAQMDAHKNLLKKEIDRLSDKLEAIDNNERRMKDSLYAAMVAMDKRKIETDLHKFSIRKAGGKQTMTITGEVPDNFQKVILEPDNKKIREALEAGEVLDFAHLEERGEYLKID